MGYVKNDVNLIIGKVIKNKTVVDQYNTIRQKKEGFTMVEKDNLIFISDDVIKVLTGGHVLDEIKNRPSKSNRSINVTDPVNRYYRVNNFENLVLMHLIEYYYIFISENVTTPGGQVNLVDELYQCYWSIGSRSGVSNNDGVYISREIMRIITNGKNGAKLNLNDEVHHKGMRSYNTQNALILLSNQEHRDYHHLYGQQSHRGGIVILNTKSFFGQCNIVVSL